MEKSDYYIAELKQGGFTDTQARAIVIVQLQREIDLMDKVRSMILTGLLTK